MEKQPTYRVKEVNQKFYIQIKVIESNWRGKKTERWTDVNIVGMDNYDPILGDCYMQPMKGFKTLIEAQNKIKEFNLKPIYHELRNL